MALAVCCQAVIYLQYVIEDMGFGGYVGQGNDDGNMGIDTSQVRFGPQPERRADDLDYVYFGGCPEVEDWLKGGSVVLVDNKAAITLANDTLITAKNRFYSRLAHYSKECVAQGRVDIRWVPSGRNYSDGCTKNIDYETFAVIEYELYANVGSSLVAVLVMVAVILLHPVVAFLVFACIASVILNLFGLMYIWGVNIDSVVTINLILALGFAVDYSAHIGHSFLYAQTSGTSRQRTLHALEEIGGSVLNGAISTFLAVLVLAFSGSYVFRVFFKMFFGIVLFGVLNGLVLLPVLLAYFGPGDVTLGKCTDGDGAPRRICTPVCASVAWLPFVSRIFADPTAEVAAENDAETPAAPPALKLGDAARKTVTI